MSLLSGLTGFAAWADAASLTTWQRWLADLYGVAAASIGLACLVIALYLVLQYLKPWRRRQVPYCAIVWVVAWFLLFCGVFSCLGTLSIKPASPLHCAISLGMAAASWMAMLVLAYLVARAQAPCDPCDFENEMAERRRTQAELMRVNARLNAVLDASTQVSIIATDPDGLITVFNPGAKRMLGYSAEEMVGKATPLRIHDAQELEIHASLLSAEFGTPVSGIDALVERARRGGHDVSEWTYLRKDGSRLTVQLAVTAVVDPEGRINGFLGIATDLTDRQRAEQKLRSSEARFRRLVDANILGVVFGDIKGNITDANDAFLEMVQYTREEMVAGKLPWDALVPASSYPLLEHCREELKLWGRCNPQELVCQRKDGSNIPVLLGVALLDERQPAEPGAPLVAFCLDLSERKRLEDQLRNQASELAEADVRKNEFLAMLGHELRNPLAPIRNAVKIMKQRGSDDPALCWAREVIDGQMRQMAQLVDDLLEISRVNRGKVRLQKEVVAVDTIVQLAVETSRPIIDAHRHRLSIALRSEAILVEADVVRMAQVLSNLLNNAAKYTDDGGNIQLAAYVQGEDAVFEVRDDGIGIPAEMLSKVFDLFTQADRSLDRSQGGLGLGLTLVKRLVEMHGGTVVATSEGLNKGSRFIVRLPLWRKSETIGEVEPPSPELSEGNPGISSLITHSRKVLVVDDNVASAESMELLLSLEGHEVQVVFDGPSAIQAVEQHHHDVVLMDIGLPKMSGYDVARTIRQQADLGDPLLVAVTGYAEDEARRRSREAGFHHHLVKPVNPDTILRLLQSLDRPAGEQVFDDATSLHGTEETTPPVYRSIHRLNSQW
ncbi:MAG: PAS domain S-box protein [Isosphaeraceae bacterium]